MPVPRRPRAATLEEVIRARIRRLPDGGAAAAARSSPSRDSPCIRPSRGTPPASRATTDASSVCAPST